MNLVPKRKKAIITGAASGIGKATAKLFAQQGFDLGLIDMDEDGIKDLYDEIKTEGNSCFYHIGDVGENSDVKNGLEYLYGKLGHLDVLICNAGTNGTWAPIETMDVSNWDQTMSVNLKSTFLCVKYSIPFMKNTGGAITIVSSINGTRTFSNFGASAYSSSKAAQVSFAKMAALELARYDIRVNVICPGDIDTPINSKTTYTDDLIDIKIQVDYPSGNRPLKKKSNTPKQVAQSILFLSSESASNVTGTELYIDGAESLL